MTKPTRQATLRTYLSGYVLSLLLTVAAYLFVTHPAYSSKVLVAIILVLAVVQFLIQMVFFLHIGLETKPRWKLFVFIFMVGVVLIIVIGSIWIMNNLNYNQTPQQINTYLNDQGGGF
jgi:cytochrome o ubiquinol oxidase operon protein cyoD